MYESSIIKRIPGQTRISPKERQGYIEDLCKQSKVQLTELLERQNALLRNRGFIQRLPDKGEKISHFKTRIEAELNRRAEVDKTSALLERLNINGPLEEIEWTGSFSTTKRDKEQSLSDEEAEDEETKAIRILASHGRTSKITRVFKPPETLITERDLTELKAQPDPYATALCKKVAERCSIPVKENFKPYRTIKSRDGHSSPKPKESPAKSLQDNHSVQDEGEKHDEKASHADPSLDVDEKKISLVETSLTVDEKTVQDVNVVEMDKSLEMVKRVRHWEVTAATPPPPVHGQTLMIDLAESLALEKSAVEKTTAARTTQAMLRLTEQLQRESFARYREASESSSDEEEKAEHEEQGDDDEEPEKDEAVVYSLVD